MKDHYKSSPKHLHYNLFSLFLCHPDLPDRITNKSLGNTINTENG